MLRIGTAFATVVLGLIAGTAAAVLADATKGKTMTIAGTTSGPSTTLVALPIPENYRMVDERSVAVDGEGIELVRYERIDGRNAGIGGEHFSTVVDGTGRLKGFTRMDLAVAGGQLPSRDEAREIAMSFLRQAAPDLLPVLKISRIEPHDEPLQATHKGQSETVTLTGMKVKMLNTADGRWF
ncbi:hypothetical protein [Xanthobacter autotrophicus]|uniref:hypothetical protein n=1 Tax=Xanthobacter autotrophicus TaxID=280 RepID=UPI0024A6C1C9|nr:hypothetical protein [Xanthobacter autotrophicus]MDI4654988.1 hypothetical protein [Xanthobacter autotrophicus]